MNEQILTLARENYEPVWDSATAEEPAFVGLSRLIPVNNDNIRISTEEEAYAHMCG